MLGAGGVTPMGSVDNRASLSSWIVLDLVHGIERRKFGPLPSVDKSIPPGAWIMFVLMSIMTPKPYRGG